LKAPDVYHEQQRINRANTDKTNYLKNETVVTVNYDEQRPTGKWKDVTGVQEVGAWAAL
jgi:hypothetical protein